MLRNTIEVLASDDARLAREIEARDDVVDRLYEAVKLYVTAVTGQELDEPESRRAVEILTFTTNLEHVGDIVDRNLMELAAKKMKHRLRFSPAGLEEIRAIHAMVLANLRLALSVFITGDVALARQLLAQKIRLRAAEQAATERHLARLASGRADTLETSSLHLDIVRDLKRINAHLTAIAYAILEPTGELAQSRLRSVPARLGRERPA
jgi:phosphate:Na+ symporter